ncbi:glycosyl transferase family 90-domain-containing protein [Mycena galopus ATCC 62051]|nr:glycosyl transferase family 90-domain-containing protein [Mycena galopus ATCC 62051]
MSLARGSLLPFSENASTGRSTSMARRLRVYLPWAVILGFLGFLLVAATMTHRELLIPPSGSSPPEQQEEIAPLDPVTTAKMSIDALYARQSPSLKHATARYTLRNGRPPPQNFDKWFNFARENKCLIDEYDQIQRDLEPFHQLARENPGHFQKMVDLGRALMLNDPKGMATINITAGVVHRPPYTGSAFDGEWEGTLSKFAHVLPDMDFLINGRDEPRVVFNSRDLSTWKDAMQLQDATPFRIEPVPTGEFFKTRSGCSTLNTGRGFPIDAIEDVAFIRSSSSSGFTTDLWPMLSMTKISPCFSDILFPGQYYYESSGWSGKFSHPNDIPWDEKISQIYWRGSSNGGHIIRDNYRKFSRFRLIKIAQNHSDIINAKMTSFYESHCTFDCDRDPIVAEYNIGGGSSPREEVYKYKYALDVDGNTFSGRYLGLLRSGSLVFKATAFDEYFTDWLRPYEHYIPVRIDLADLVEKVEWAMAHDAEARQIQEMGTQFARRVLTDAQNDCYFAAVLLEWARLGRSYAPEGEEGESSADF